MLLHTVMDWVRLAAFVIATTYLPGRALRSFLPAIRPATQTALGLALALILCTLPTPIAAWALFLMALGSSAVLVILRRRRAETSTTRRLVVLPGLALAVLCLGLGPWSDASTRDDGSFVYRTGHTVGNRSVGPRPVLADAALIRARSGNTGDPFVSGHPLPRIDPRRTYLSLAEKFSGASPYFLIARAEPALLLLGVLCVGLNALPRASWLFGVLLFGSGFSFLLALIPAIRSWEFRIWAYLSESTGLPGLLTEPNLALVLFLSIAAVASAGRLPVVLAGAAILVCEPAMALPLVLALLLYTWRAPVGALAKLALLTLALIGLALSPSTLLAPLLRSLEYARLDYLAEVVSHPLEGAGNVLRSVASALVFLIISLGLRTFALRRVLQAVATPGDTQSRGLACLTLALLFCGATGLGAGNAWSLGLLLLWMPLTVVIEEALSKLSRGRRLAALAACAILVFPVSINYILHYRNSTVEEVTASEYQLALTLRERSQASAPVLHRPNRSTLSIASHLSFRPAVLCYYGRKGRYDAEDLSERSRMVRRFFETTDEVSAHEAVREYRARFVLVEKRRPLRFSEPRWLQKVAESENSILYEVH